MIEISKVYKTVETELELLNKKLLSSGQSNYKLVKEIVNHVITKGKRVRPVLLFLITKAFNAQSAKEIINSAFAIEMIHTASLLHDDVVDQTKNRRNKKTANVIWGNKETILVGDHLFTQSFLAITELQNHDATKIIADASSNLTIGEITQLENEQNINLKEEEYLDIIYYKTASLFEASAALGALFSENAHMEQCRKFGKNIGLVFQMMDDILDYSGSKTLGKDTGTDFKERKVTLPVLMLLKTVEKSEKNTIQEYFKNGTGLTFEDIKQMMNKHQSLELSYNFMQKFIDDAITFANSEISNQEIQKQLIALIKFFTERDN